MSNNFLFLCLSFSLIGVSLGDQQLFLEQNEKDGVPENAQHPPLAPISGLLPLPDSGNDPFGLFSGPRRKDGNLEQEQSGGREAQQTTGIDGNANAAGQKPQPDVVVSDPLAVLSKSKGIEGQYENANVLNDKKDPSGLFSDSSFGSNLKDSEPQKDPESNVAAIPQPQSDASNLFQGAPEKSLSNIFKSTGTSLSGNADPDIFSKDKDLNEESNPIQTNQVSQGAEGNMKTNQQILNDSKDGDVDNNNAHGEVEEEGGEEEEEEEDDWYHNPDKETFDDQKNRFQVDDFDDYGSDDADGLFGVDDDDADANDHDFDADAEDLWSKYESIDKDKNVIGDELFREGPNNENDQYSRGRFPTEELMNQFGDEVEEETKPPTAPTNMVLFYTWMILAILVMVIVVSTYQAKCKWILSKGGRQQTRGGGGGVGGEDRKRLLDNEFV